jgi:hypothetical protein
MVARRPGCAEYRGVDGFRGCVKLACERDPRDIAEGFVSVKR